MPSKLQVSYPTEYIKRRKREGGTSFVIVHLAAHQMYYHLQGYMASTNPTSLSLSSITTPFSSWQQSTFHAMQNMGRSQFGSISIPHDWQDTRMDGGNMSYSGYGKTLKAATLRQPLQP